MGHMLRIAVRNVGIAVGIALPVLLTCGALVGWLGPASWNLAAGQIHPSLTGFIGGFLYWYIILVLPTVAIATAHQALLACLPTWWSPAVLRVIILGTSLGIALLLVLRIVTTATDVRVPGLITVVLVPTIVYGVMARPLKPTQGTQAHAG